MNKLIIKSKEIDNYIGLVWSDDNKYENDMILLTTLSGIQPKYFKNVYFENYRLNSGVNLRFPNEEFTSEYLPKVYCNRHCFMKNGKMKYTLDISFNSIIPTNNTIYLL